MIYQTEYRGGGIGDRDGQARPAKAHLLVLDCQTLAGCPSDRGTHLSWLSRRVSREPRDPTLQVGFDPAYRDSPVGETVE